MHSELGVPTNCSTDVGGEENIRIQIRTVEIWEMVHRILKQDCMNRSNNDILKCKLKQLGRTPDDGGDSTILTSDPYIT